MLLFSHSVVSDSLQPRGLQHGLNERQIDQLDRIRSPEIDLHVYSLLIYYESVTEVQWEKDSLRIK